MGRKKNKKYKKDNFKSYSIYNFTFYINIFWN